MKLAASWPKRVVRYSSDGSGWNGNYAGKPQASGTYVWVVQGRDYTNKIIKKKGTMVLIR